MGQPNGTANGTTCGTAEKCIPSNNSLPLEDHGRMRMDRCTHAEWDKQKGVPFENPVMESDLSNGTSTEDSREYDF